MERFYGTDGDGIDSWETMMFIYKSALKKVTLNMEILNDEFQYLHNYNPIEHIKSRLKEPESIVKKLKRHGLESTIDNMVDHIHDIAGVRVICSFTSDIYLLADMIRHSHNMTVVKIKDYIAEPKASGYRSYHMLVTVPMSVKGHTFDTYVEIQIRTVAMDFWASLEHKLQYKFEGHDNAPIQMNEELKQLSRIINELDERMMTLNTEIMVAEKMKADKERIEK